MSTPGRSASGALFPVRGAAVVWLLLACGVALSPLSSKIAGVVWLLFSGWGIFLVLRGRRAGAPVAGAGLPAARCWLLACAVFTVLGGAVLWYWSDPFDGMNAELRLLIAAVATWGVLARGAALPRHFRAGSGFALAGSCLVALLCIVGVLALYPNPRDNLPANAIVWAMGAGFALCLLLPLVLDGDAPAGWRRWWLGAVVLGVAAVLLSQSRGAMGVFAWMLWLVVERWRRRRGHWPLARMGALLLAVVAVVAALWAAPGDPLRLRQAEHEVVRAEDNGRFDTSMGTRVYLWHLARDGIVSSPWIGIGGAERLRRIKHAGDELPEAQRAGLWYVRLMGHVHNQYLHSALDGGMVGLASILALMAGMAGVAWRLRRVDPLASRQMQGLLFVHATGCVTNVNFAHNYYVLALGMGVTLVLLGAAQRGTTGAVAPASRP
ncbi:MAG: O-antigen ligase family protein [Pseudomonadota bacterium]